METPRIVAHLDMDAFYASVELLRYPDLVGAPVVIGGGRDSTPQTVVDPGTGATRRIYKRLGDYAGRGVITTATYAAREFGLRSAMPMMKAAKLAPQAILLPTDFDTYRAISRRFKAAVREIAPLVEDRGIDEIYIELTPVVASRVDDRADGWWCARDVGEELRAAVSQATGLTCSIGLAPNKLVAKIASELDKPDGLTLVTPADIPTRIWPLPARRLNGVGPKADAKLAELGIRFIGDIAQADDALRAAIASRFGARYTAWLHAAAHGRDERPVVAESEPVSISRETTFERDLHARRDRALLTPIFTELCEQLGGDLQRKGYKARTIGIKLRFDDFKIVTRVRTIDEAIDDPQRIRGVAAGCLKLVDLSRRIRLLGVRAASLQKQSSANPL